MASPGGEPTFAEAIVNEELRRFQTVAPSPQNGKVRPEAAARCRRDIGRP
jgi:hypothetical protein